MVDTFAGVDYTNISCSQSANFNTQPESIWTATLSLTKYPIADPVDTGFFPFRGFGIDDEADYSMIALCAHPGHDFVPLNKSGRKVVAIADGIVVGMGEHGTSKRPALWGATDGGYNLVIRIGGHFVLYGHLSQIEAHLYLGARVRSGEVLGTLSNRGPNTHLHIEVDAFSGATSAFLRPRFGAIKFDGASNPPLVIDPMAFVTTRGTLQGTSNSVQTPCTSVYTYSRYNGGSVGGVSFDYIVRDDLRLNCFNITNGQIITSTPPSTCLSAQP